MRPASAEPWLIGVPPEPGQIVRVRQRQYLVEETVPPPAPGDATLVRLACLDDDAQGEPLAVFWEHELDPEVLTAESWEHLATRGFDPADRFAAYLHALRWNCVTATDAKLFQSPFRAGIRLDAYQLEPLRKALLLPRVNLFIADDVGLGKTIEAGLIARELLLRRKARDLVVAAPPSMLLQWQEELEQRFGLTCQILDKAYVARVRQERGYGVNPWTTHSRFLVSQRLLIDEAYATPLRDWLGELRPGALLILDEAHHAAPASGARYAIDSKFTRVVRDLAPRFEHRLFLSATPHNGHSNSFSALLELLDPQRFCRGVKVRQKQLDDVMVRRLKDDIREIAGGFPKRLVVQEDIDGLPADAPELRLAELLDQYRAVRERSVEGASKRTQAAAALLVTNLQQRLLSSIEAFARTLAVHRRTLERQRAAARDAPATKVAARRGREPEDTRNLMLALQPVGADDDRAELSEAELQAEEEAQVEAATLAAAPERADAAREADEDRLLEAMTELASRWRGEPDARLRTLVEWIRANQCPDLPPLDATPAPGTPPARWNARRLIVFTEYDDTKRWLRQQLERALHHSDRAAERILLFHGPTPPAEREEIKRAFTADPRRHPVRILLATDAAREGLNLQAHCADLFHFDVPWNPSRMEQRNGRIDRKLQPEAEVRCHYFFYAQRPEDRVLQVLVGKTERIRRELGSLSQVIDDRLGDLLKGGIRRRDADDLARRIDGADLDAERKRTMAEELEESRQRQDALRKQIDLLRTRLAAAQDWIGLKEDAFRAALDCGLELVGAEPLKPEKGDGTGPPRWIFPALDQRPGAASWVETMDTLRPPRRRDQKPWEWRRDAPARPVVFADTGTMDDDAVHLHLEHRVVQRLLGRFLAQGFVHHDLSRACLAQTGDPIPRVVLIGRLALYGPGAVRLHEELVSVTARWLEPARRKGALAPYARDAERKTLALLEEALLHPGRRIAEAVRRQLQAAAPRDVADLLPRLAANAEGLAADAAERLAERGGAESASMRLILEQQRDSVLKTARASDDPQYAFNFNGEEKRQLDSNRRHWQRRLETLKQDLAGEPARIRDQYEVRARRIEPIGLVYLWPVTG